MSVNGALYLIGPRGAGKSAVGARMAAALGCPFVDADDEVARRARLSVARIFVERGEPAFRTLERRVMLELLNGAHEAPAVFGTGGGCVLDPDVRSSLQQKRCVVWLRCNPEAARARIAGSDRPSLTGADPDEEWAAVAARRQPHYEACARRSLDTTTMTIEEAADAVQHLWAELSRHDLR